MVNYFACYVPRTIAISDHRLSYDGQTVHFRYRDRKDSSRLKTAKLDATTFCRSILQHVLPSGFVRIRRYGLLSNRVRKPLLDRCRELLGADPPLLLAPPGESRPEALRRIFGVEPELCPTCKLGRLIVRAEGAHPYPPRRHPCHPHAKGSMNITLDRASLTSRLGYAQATPDVSLPVDRLARPRAPRPLHRHARQNPSATTDAAPAAESNSGLPQPATSSGTASSGHGRGSPC